MAIMDLTVRGAGIFGLSVAWEALRRGARVRVIDPEGVGAGASGGVLGALQPHVPDNWNAKKQFQLESLLAAELFWADVEAVSGMPSGYARNGRLQPLATQRDVDLARARRAGAREHWQGRADWDVIASAEAGDWHPPSPSGFLVKDTLSASLSPRQAVASLAAAIRTRGGDITTQGEDEGRIVWATGWQGLIALGDALGKPVGNGVKGQAARLGHDAGEAPQIFADGLHIVPHNDGTVAIGSTSERTFDDPATTDRQLDELIVRASEILPILKGARVLSRWAGVRPRATSRAPLLGPWPDRPGHFIANGGFKIGFGMAPGVARRMTALILDGQDDIPAEFHTDRL